MPRVKRANIHIKKRRKLFAKVKGFKWRRKNTVKQAKEAVVKSGVNAYIDRRKKKRTMRGLWQIKISAFAKEQGLSYSKFINALKKNNIELDRKVLADLAVNNKEVLVKIIEKVK